MRIFISKKPETLARAYGIDVYNTHLGLMQVPPRSRYLTEMDVLWGMDNGRYVCMDWTDESWHLEKWDRDSFVSLLESRQTLSGCKFVVAPDVLLNHDATLKEFWQWRDYIMSFGYSVAFAVQDGARVGDIPFDKCDALFIGGSNALKFSYTCRIAVNEAKARGMWVHWGRASTPNFIHYAKGIGCDSIDSSAFARFTDDRLPRALALLTHIQHTFL